MFGIGGRSMRKCPFWSTNNEKVNCYKECPMNPISNENEGCPFNEVSSLNREVKFVDSINEDLFYTQDRYLNYEDDSKVINYN